MPRVLTPASLLLLLLPAAAASFLPAAPADTSPGLASSGDEDEPLCAQKYEAGVYTTWPCPAELCNLDGGLIVGVATGPTGGEVPVGTLTCHDSAHGVHEEFNDLPPNGVRPTFNPTGAWYIVRGRFPGAPDPFDPGLPPPLQGRHAHCTVDPGDATFAFYQCVKN